MVKVTILLIAVICAFSAPAVNSRQPNLPSLKGPRQQASESAPSGEGSGASAIHLSIATVGPMLGPPTERYRVGDQVPIAISMTNTSSEPTYACVSTDLYQDLPKLKKNGRLIPYAKWQSDWLAHAQKNQTCQHEDLPESTLLKTNQSTVVDFLVLVDDSRFPTGAVSWYPPLTPGAYELSLQRRIGCCDGLRQGEVVFAFGSPEGLQDSVTMGVVSAVARQPDADSSMVFVQTDAPINPGSSGGPLVNVDGEVVGINTFIVTEGGGNEGLGFAIPSSIVGFAYPQLRRYGHVHRGETGITVQAITPSLAAGLKLPGDWGVIVSDVAPGSPADDAGVKVKDIVTSIDGTPAGNLPSVGTRLFMRRGGETIKLAVLRGAEKLSFNVLVVELPHDVDRLADLADPNKSLVSKLGVVGVEIDPKLAGTLPGLRVSSGVLVAARAADPSVDISLATGDVIHAINGVEVETIAALRSALDHLAPNTAVVLQIERDGRLMFVSFELD